MIYLSPLFISLSIHTLQVITRIHLLLFLMGFVRNPSDRLHTYDRTLVIPYGRHTNFSISATKFSSMASSTNNIGLIDQQEMMVRSLTLTRRVASVTEILGVLHQDTDVTT